MTTSPIFTYATHDAILALGNRDLFQLHNLARELQLKANKPFHSVNFTYATTIKVACANEMKQRNMGGA